jgi:predicted membrane-bound spermidine synthase
MPFFELGSLTVALTFVILAALGTAGIILPLVRLGQGARGKLGVLLYFGGLGAGFMFVEIGLMLSAHAWLGSPVLATAVILTALLFASGIGSLWSERWIADTRKQQRALLAITAGIAGVAVLLSALASVARTWAVGAQLALLLCLVAPLGIMMGLAFPLGLRRLELSEPAQIPWAWAINGCVSVATPAAAMLLAMSAGFTAVFVASAIAYGSAWLSVVLARSRLPKDALT